jgi:primosomal protein N'
VLRLDRESTKERKQALRTVETFYNSPGSVLVGTELALPFLTKPLHTVAVASLDELFSIPDFRIHERVLYLLYKLRSIADDTFLLQTRTPDSPALQAVFEGNVHTFIENELEMRKVLHFPPFSIPIKITCYGKPDALGSAMQELALKLKPSVFDIFPALEKHPKGKVGLSGVIKIPVSAWPDERILNILRALPRSVEINVDPVSFS